MCFLVENPKKNWMRTGKTPIFSLGNLHINPYHLQNKSRICPVALRVHHPMFFAASNKARPGDVAVMDSSLK